MTTIFRWIPAAALLTAWSLGAQVIQVSTGSGGVTLAQICNETNPPVVSPATCAANTPSTGTITLQGQGSGGKAFPPTRFTATTYSTPGPGFLISPPQNWLRVASTASPTPSTSVSGTLTSTTVLTVTADPKVVLTRSAQYLGYVIISAPGVNVSPSIIPVSLSNQWFPPNTADSPAPQLGLASPYTFSPGGGSVGLSVNFPSNTTPAPGPYYTTAVQIGGGQANWLTVTPPNSPVGSKQLTLAANVAGLAGGQSYDALITVQSADASGNPNSDNKSYLQVFIVPPVTAVSFNVVPGSLTFPVNAGSSVQATSPLNVFYSATGAATGFTATAQTDVGAGWLTVSPQGGSANTTLTVAVDPSHLAAGQSTGEIVISAPGASNSPITVPVTVRAILPPSITGISPQNVPASVSSQRIAVFGANFQSGLTAVLGFPDGATQQLSGQILDSITPSSFGLTARISTAGAYTLQIVNPDSGTSNLFSFSVVGSSPAPVLTLNPASVSLMATAGSASRITQSVMVSTGGSPLGFSVSTPGSAGWLSTDTTGGITPASFTLSVDPTRLSAGLNQATVVISAAGTGNSPVNLPVSVTLPVPGGPVPTINTGGVVLNPTPTPVTTISPGAWVSVYGDNLAPADPNGRDWGGLIVSGKLPATIDGVGVTINGKAAAVNYISKQLINVQAPDDSTTGTVNVVVTTPYGSSGAVPVNLQSYSPALFALAGSKYAIAQIYPDNASAAPVGFIKGIQSRPAKPGDIITLYGTGFGPTKAPAPAGFVVPAAVELSSGVTATIGGAVTQVNYAGLAGAGLNQIQLTIPNVGPGDQLLVLTVAGIRTLSTLYLSIGN